MIREATNQTIKRKQARSLAHYIQTELETEESQVKFGEQKQRQHAAAAAVAAFLADTTSAQAVSSEYLLMLTARALWGVGEVPAAERLAKAKAGALNFSSRYLEAVFAEKISLSAWQALYVSRLVRPVGFFSLGGKTLWVIDMPKLASLCSPIWELSLARTIQLVLSHLADIWDETQGEGLLGLSQTREAAAALLATSATSVKSRRLAQEIKRQVWIWLDSLKGKRGWRTVPSLINLHLH